MKILVMNTVDRDNLILFVMNNLINSRWERNKQVPVLRSSF